MATVKENILNSLNWFYDKLTSLYLKPIIKMLLTGKVYGWLLDQDGNVIMSNEDDGITLNWRLYEHDMIADYFDESLTYNIGDYCVYDNKLYKFVSQKDPGEWDDSAAGVVNVGKELGENTSDISSLSSSLSSLSTTVDGKAPTSHASSDTTYGVGTTSNYGHCRTINNLTTSSHTNGYALSAYQGYVLNSNMSSLLSVQSVSSEEYDFGGVSTAGASTTLTASASRSGYTPLGIVGYRLSNGTGGSGCSWLNVYNCWLNSTTATAGVIRNSANGSTSVVYITFYILYMKN